jgi:transcription elongation factor GreB
VLAPSPADRDEVRFGARVRVRGEDSHAREVQIVGVDEADPAAGLVAFVAPLARALLGQRVGDVVTVRTPGGEEEVTVLAVDYERA